MLCEVYYMSYTEWSAASYARYENLDVILFLIYRANILVEQPAGTTCSANFILRHIRCLSTDYLVLRFKSRTLD